MGFLDSFKRPVPLPAEETFRCSVAGTRFYGGSLLKAGLHRAEMRREPKNRHDENAVVVTVGSRTIGHLSRADAARVAPLMDLAGIVAFRTDVILTAKGVFGIRVPLTTNPVFGEHARSGPALAAHGAVRIPWGRASRKLEVEDESMHREGLVLASRLLGRVPAVGGTEMDAHARLIPQGHGDDFAIMVAIRGEIVGRLSEVDERDYREILVALARTGQTLEVEARLWVIDDDIPRGRVTVKLPVPGEVVPPLSMPAGPIAVLPPGSKVQVTREEHYLDYVATLLEGEQEAPIVVTLHSATSIGSGGREVVQIQCFGEPVGELTSATSAHFLPIVDAAERANIALVARAIVRGNRLKADVVLDVTKGGDLPADWIDQHFPAPGRS